MSQYLTNEFLLKELERNWLRYCWWENEGDQLYDVMVTSMDDVLDDGRIYRVKTWSHIPITDTPYNMLRQHNGRHHKRINMTPFVHYRNGRIILKSNYHSETEFGLGELVPSNLDNPNMELMHHPDAPSITDGLARAYLLLVNNVGKNGRFSNYTWLEDMKYEAIQMLLTKGLFFDLITFQDNPNPFTFMTTMVWNEFRLYLKARKKEKELSELLFRAGAEYLNEQILNVHLDQCVL